jgi:error-prone DNA polymerase
MVSGFSEAHARRIEEAQATGPFRSVGDFARRTGLSRAVIVRLAKAGAFESLGLNRRGALWHALGQETKQERLPLFDEKEEDSELQISNAEAQASSATQSPPTKSSNLQLDISTPKEVSLPKMSPAQEVLADYRTTGLSLRAHPMSFLRKGLEAMKVVPAERLAAWPNGKPVRVAGIVLVRQRPGTAKGITFVTLEDETGTANLIIRPDVWKKFRPAALGATVLLAHGRLQREGLVIHVLVSRLENLSDRMQELSSHSRDFC